MNPLIVLMLLITSVASAAIYDVGPGYTKTHLRDVVWDQLQPGDIVNIHTTPGGYHETVAITQSGTAAQHIIVRGIPDAQGNLPVIDGSGAVVDPNIHLYYPSLVGLGAIIISLNNHSSYGTSPSYIDIESLEVCNAHMGNTYTNGGTTFNYSKFTSGIYIEHSHFMTIRGCNLHHNGLGLFANSKYGGLGTSTQNILVEHNWIHENGNVGSSSEHGIYVESVGAVYQYNIIGPQLAGAYATGIKDRSSGCVIRYNAFLNSGGSNGNGYVIMLVDPAYPLQYARPDYRETFMYGNTFTNPGSTPLILYGGDQPNYAHYRQGTLYFYHNTVVTVADSTPYNYSSIIVLPTKAASGGAPITETIDARNNIFAALPITPGGTAAKIYLMDTDMPGTLNLGTNWCSPNTFLSTSPPASVTGAANILYGNAGGANNPAFLNASMLDYRLAADARSIDAASPLSPAVTSNTLGGDFTPTEEIGPAQASHARVTLGAAPDLGAFESDGSAAAAAAGALGFAYSTYGQVFYENSGTITFTVSRIGGSAGAVDLDYTTLDESATAGADFSAASGTLHWAAGDSATKSFTVTVLPDAITEAAETFGVRLTNPTNGALLGPSTYIQNQIRDGSSGGGGNPVGGALAFSTNAYVASEGVGSAGALVTVNRSGSTTGAVSVQYATSNGTASGADYTTATGTLNWAAGDASPQSFTVAINDDAFAEINETIVLSLTSPTGGAALGNPATATLTINDNDHTPTPPQELIYAVGATSGSLIAFYSDAPHTPLITVPITGLPANEIVRGIDFDPFTGKLYAVVINFGLPVTANHLYTIDPLTGFATLVNATSFTPLLAHPSIDLAFNLITGDLNIAVGTGQQNIRLNPLNGNVIASDTPFAYVAGDPNAGATPSIVGADFQLLNNGTATYYGIDQTLDVLVRVGSTGGTPNAATTGQLTTIGLLGVDTAGVTGLDFSRTSGGAFACMGGPGATTGDLYYLDTTTGAATLIGQIALPEAVRDIAVAPPYLAWKHTHFTGNVQVPSIAGDTANPAHDGIANLMKYAFGMDPATSSRTGLPLNGFAGGKLRLGFNRAASDVQYQVQASNDLTIWTPAVTTDVTPLGSPAGWTEIEESISNMNSTHHFLRLQVLLP
ncbi:MAG: hypothetical protein B7Z37_00570 [Verrucomicrobia bacterium 12-59-8]|nr:MAG: hypothetical protein B7Z37_00570 [Verrucomicrobia bacterium 12-59-8]